MVNLACVFTASLQILPKYDAQMPREVSTTSDGYNQDVLVAYFSKAYATKPFAGALPVEQRKELQELRALAYDHPVLALAAAQSLYMFGWYVGDAESGEADVENIESAATFFESSIAFSHCEDPALSQQEFLDERSCDVRWSHALALRDFLSQWHAKSGEHDLSNFQSQRALALLQGLKATSYFGGRCCEHWVSPSDFNFNAVFFPGVPSAPVWTEIGTRRPALATFLEEHFSQIQEELRDLLEVPRDVWLESGAPGIINAEHLASGGGAWHMLAIVRHGVWNEVFCANAPRTCALLAARPEIVNCTVSNSNIMRLAPGGSVKPHFGNAPRLALHLPLFVPEPDKATMRVGGANVTWNEGQVLVFDDTYAHSVQHFGSLPRHVLNVWFCHPCDTNAVHQHNQQCFV